MRVASDAVTPARSDRRRRPRSISSGSTTAASSAANAKIATARSAARRRRRAPRASCRAGREAGPRAAEHGVRPSRDDEGVDDRDRQRERERPAQRAARPRGSHARGAAAASVTRERAPARSGWSKDSATRAERDAPPRRRAARRAAGSTGGDGGDHGPVPAPAPAAARPGPVDGEREVLLEAVGGQRGRRGGDADVVGPRDDPGRRLRLHAGCGDQPAARAQRAHRPAVLVEQHDRVAGRASAARKTPLVCGPASSRRAPRRVRTSAQRPTTTRSTSSPGTARAARGASDFTPASSRRFCDLVARASSASPAQTSFTGNRLPSSPVLNGSGNEPTTAGTRCAASQARWSHHTRSPARDPPLGGPDGRLDAVHVVEPVGPPAALAAARRRPRSPARSRRRSGSRLRTCAGATASRCRPRTPSPDRRPRAVTSAPKSRVTVSDTSPVDSPAPNPQPASGSRTRRASRRLIRR